jgi:hypothetical protein
VRALGGSLIRKTVSRILLTPIKIRNKIHARWLAITSSPSSKYAWTWVYVSVGFNTIKALLQNRLRLELFGFSASTV